MSNNIETIQIVSGKNSLKEVIFKEYFEKNSEIIKNEIISFVSLIKSKKINGLRLKNFLSFDKNFSTWDLSLINEKNVYKSDSILNLTKYLTIQKILKKNNSKKTILKNFDEKFLKKFRKTNLYKNNDFQIISERKEKTNFRETILNKVNNSIILSTFYFFFFLLKNLSFRGSENINELKIKSVFFTYFTQYDRQRFKQGKFCPKQWPSETYKLNYTLWVNIFLPNKEFKNIHQLNNFVKNKKINNILFINNFLSFNILFKILKTFLSSVYKFYFFVRKIKYDKKIENDSIIFLKDDIKKSLCCFHLLQNLAYHYLIQNLFEKIKKNDNKIFYLFENQPWERSLIFRNRNLKKHKIFAYSHTTINYWHLNYFNTKTDNKHYLDNFLPEKILCHSRNCRAHLLSQGYKSNQLLNVSAERFRWATNISKINFSKKNKKILVIGDYEKRINLNLINLINDLANNGLYDQKFSIIYKPHPSTFYDLSNLNSKISTTRKDLKDILKNFEIIVSTNSTAASAEVSLAKKNVLIFVDYLNLDLSPFKLKNKFKNDFNFSHQSDLRKLLLKKNIKNFKGYNFYFKRKYQKNWEKLFK